MPELGGDDFSTLLGLPSPAVLTTYRRDGSALVSPVWFGSDGEFLQVVIAEGDVKLRHLARRPRCSLLVFESVPPFRGLRADGCPELSHEGVTEARRAIASRYLGRDRGERLTASRGPGVLLRLPLAAARRWSLAAILPR